MRRSILLSVFAALALLSVDTWAAEIDATAAQRVAQQFLASQSVGKLRAGGASLQLLHAEASVSLAGAADYYVFNTDDGGAFVIVAGDDRISDVLGYGEGSLDMTNLPCGLKWLLGSYREQMEYLLTHPSAEAEGQLSHDSPTVMPMLTCTWSQSEPYYNQCPIYQGERCVTGCIATAMAQVMYYWRYPSQLPAVSGYTTRSNNISVPSLPSKVLDWDNMIDSYKGQYTSAQADAVATLMRYCGQSARMDYGPDGSGAYVSQQLQGMRSFGYSSATMMERSSYSAEDWEQMVIEDLTEGRPVLYSGTDVMAGGHAFVLDGCNDGLYHVNWGWAATGNGYFRLKGLIVRGYSFISSHQMLHGVFPRTQVEPEIGYDFEHEGIYYMYDEIGSNVLVTYRDTRFGSYSGTVTIPATVDYDGEKLPVIGIGKDAFRDCINLTEVQLPQSIRTIGERAFRNCLGLTSVTLPDHVVSLSDQAFVNCFGLTSIDLPSSLVAIGEQAFGECSGLTRVGTPSLEAWLSIDFADHYANPLSYAHSLHVNGQLLKDLVVPPTVNAVKRFAFIECSGLQSVTISDGVTTVGEAAFAYCDHIAALSLPASLQTMEKQAFYGCKLLTNVAIPDQVTSLSSALFQECTRLSNISIPEGVIKIEDNAFNSCTSLVTLTIPGTVETIGKGTFAKCTALKGIVLPNSVVSLGSGAFQGDTLLREVTLSQSLPLIMSNTFQGCAALTHLVVPDLVTQIESQAFYQCGGLVELTLGSSLSKIGKKAFYGSPLITLVTCRALTPPEIEGADSFTRSIYPKALLRVPEASFQIYKKTGIWPWFTRMSGVNVDFALGDVNCDGEINIADINFVIDAILSTNKSMACDVNGDGEINVADVNAIIDLILNSH